MKTNTSYYVYLLSPTFPHNAVSGFCSRFRRCCRQSNVSSTQSAPPADSPLLQMARATRRGASTPPLRARQLLPRVAEIAARRGLVDRALRHPSVFSGEFLPPSLLPLLLSPPVDCCRHCGGCRCRVGCR